MITIKATEGDVTFGDTKEGTFGVRVAGTMKVDERLGGRIVNSEGLTNGDAWGKPADWVDYITVTPGQKTSRNPNSRFTTERRSRRPQ